MTKELSNEFFLDEKKINTLETAGVIPKGTPLGQIEVFSQVCKEKELSPFSKEIYLVGYGGKYSVITGIDGYRKIAARNGLAGTEDAIFDLQPDGAFFTSAQLKASGRLPTTATVTVYRIVGGFRCPFTHTAVFSEFAGKGKWQTMPFQMIAKVAEAFAIRKGFADSVSGILIREEMAAFNGENIKPKITIEKKEKEDDETRLKKAIEKAESVAVLLNYEQYIDQFNARKEYDEKFNYLSNKELENE